MDWLFVPAAYLVGSLQPGLILVRLTHKQDVRDFGSGKTGVTNVLRVAGKRTAALVMLLDFAKGLGPVLLARAVSGDHWVEAGVAAAALVGHIVPIFSGFRGGRGVATGLGTAMGLLPWSGLVGLGVFAPVLLLTRYVSLGSLLGIAGAAVLFVVAAVVWGLPLPYLVYALVCGPLIFWTHRDNIQRLLTGKERRIGDSSAAQESA